MSAHNKDPDTLHLMTQELHCMCEKQRDKARVLAFQLRIEKKKSMQLEADIVRLKTQHEAELQHIKKQNDQFIAQLIEEMMHMVRGSKHNDLVSQLCTRSVGDTGSSSEIFNTLKERLDEVAEDSQISGTTLTLTDPLANVMEPFAPEPQLISQPHIFQHRLQSVLPQLQLKPKPMYAPPGLNLHKDMFKDSSGFEHPCSAGNLSLSSPEERWDSDDERLLQMEEREAMENGVDKHNAETFGHLHDGADEVSQDSERTDYTGLVQEDVCKVETQLKVQKMLSIHFKKTFSTFKEAVIHLQELPQGSPEFDAFENKFVHRFGKAEPMFKFLDKINHQSNEAKHPRNIPALTELANYLEEEHTNGNEEQSSVAQNEAEVAEALAKHVTTCFDGSMPANLMNTFYSQDPMYKEIITKGGRKCREFCAIHPGLLQFEVAESGPGLVKVSCTWPHDEVGIPWIVTDVIERSPYVAKQLCVVITLTDEEQSMGVEELWKHIQQCEDGQYPAPPIKSKRLATVGCATPEVAMNLIESFSGRAEKFKLRWPAKLPILQILNKKPALAELLLLFFHIDQGKQAKDLVKDIQETAKVMLPVDPFIPDGKAFAFVGCKTEDDRKRVLSLFSSEAAPYRSKAKAK